MMFAYVDPSVMSYTVQAIAGVAIALGVVFGVVWRKIKRGPTRRLDVMRTRARKWKKRSKPFNS